MGARTDDGRGDRAAARGGQVLNDDAHAATAQFTGIVLIVGGSVLLAAKGIFAKLLYARGLDFETVVATRALLAIPGFVLIAIARAGPAQLRLAKRRDLLGAAAAGFVCYYVGASMNFYALTLIDASVERAILYSYPAIVVLVAWWMSRLRPSNLTLYAVAGTFAGIVLVVGVLRPGLAPQNLLGVLFVLLCSMTIVFYFLVSGRLTRTLGSAQFTAVAMTTAGLALALHYQVRHGWQNLSMDAVSFWLMLGLVIFATVLPLVLVAEGLRRVGAQRAAIASTSGPPAAALMAAILLGEQVRIDQWVGIVLIIGSIALLERRRSDTV